MFEDVCLACGKDVADGRPYCNDVCQSGDLTSPSLSSASSTFSSPHLQYTNGVDVPALVPSALGKALRAYSTTHDRYSTSSSSASSASWSVLTDDDDDSSEYGEPYNRGVPATSLSYTRRPSGTNNRSTFPHLHRRTSSASSSSLVVCSLPQSAPSTRCTHPTDDDDDESDAAPPQPATVKSKRTLKRTNRASLPAYFSILQASPPATTLATATAVPTAPSHASPISSSSAHTLAQRPSPPTPKLTLVASNAYTHHHPANSPSARKVADWSSALERGRRHSPREPSPRPRVHTSSPSSERSVERGYYGDRDRDVAQRASRTRTRGRARVDELDGPGSPERPGFGYGRSGLVGRALLRRGPGGGEGVVPL
ncbi:hypothetical protein C8J57DRAFT_657916 [Mycena rebaudengoi]|nr:hypothetical protein C8J57DRAFT_657916 [Mycena rebaudengoi]